MSGSIVRRISNICVFCGSSPGKDGVYVEAASNLGKILAERKIHLVYGGGSLGLMGCVATAAYVGGSQVLGIIPSPLTVGNITGKTVGEELKVSSMHERIARMLVNSDAFIALPGGFGTLEEIFQIVSWTQINLHDKPIGLLNVNNFFDGLLSFLDQAVEQKLISQPSRRILISASDANKLIDELQAYVHEPNVVAAQIKWPERGIKRKMLDLTLRL